jgi:hypothetical protein
LFKEAVLHRALDKILRQNNLPLGLEKECCVYLPSFCAISLFVWKNWAFSGMLAKLALKSGVTFTSDKINKKMS